MASIQLELDNIDILKKRDRWNLYFLIATDLPGDPSKKAISSVPNNGRIKLTNKTDGQYSFKPKGQGGNGMIIFESPMPADSSARASMWVMQDRKELRSTGDILSEVGNVVGEKNVQATIVKALGSFNPWILVGTEAFGLLGSALEKLKDRNLGFLSLDQNFSEAQVKGGTFGLSNKVSTGFAELSWTWKVNN